MRTTLLAVLVISALLLVACPREAVQKPAPAPAAGASLVQELNTLDSADADVSLSEFDSLDQELAGLQI